MKFAVKPRPVKSSIRAAAAAGIVISFVISTPAIAQYSKSPPATTAPIPAEGIMVYRPVAINGQWVDTYYPSHPSEGQSTPPGTGQSPSCIVVYYHGGGFHLGSPREVASSNQLLVAAVQRSGCMFMIPSYPTNPGPNVQYTIPAIVGDTERAGSVFGSFNTLFKQYIQPWMHSNPQLKIWTAGTSAGAILAQRIAASGHWPITGTFLIAPPVKNAQYFGSETEEQDVAILDPLGPTCEQRMRNDTDCSHARALFEIEKSAAWSPRATTNDLSYYAASTPAGLQTHVLINACDDVADLGSFMRGYFNHLDPAHRHISIWKGFSKAEINALANGPDTPEHAYKGAQHAFYERILQAYLNDSTGNDSWAARNQANVPPIAGRYRDYCEAGADTSHFRGNLIN